MKKISNSFVLMVCMGLLVPVWVHAQDMSMPAAQDSIFFQEPQQGLFHASIELPIVTTTNEVVPFWMRANRFGNVPVAGTSGGLIGSISKSYETGRKGVFDWRAGMVYRLNIGSKTEGTLIEGFAAIKAGIFELKAGRSRDITGLVDSTLSSGALAVSGNALGIPKIELSVPEYWRLPILGGILSFKGNFSYGWFGTTPINPVGGGGAKKDNIPPISSYYHQKSLYGRFGKPGWRLNIFAGFNHQTMYGNEDDIYEGFNLSKMQSFFYVVTGQTWRANSGFATKLGNQLGSIDFGATYDLGTTQVFLYRQQIYDVGALSKLANVQDGLTGISLKNKRKGNSGWSKVLVEFLYTKNQAGELWSKVTKSGDENYYNNYMYGGGWSYRDQGIGNPFLTPRHEARAELRHKTGEYFVNNRVIAFNAGFIGNIGSVNITTRLSYSRNFGTYGTSPIGTSLGKRREVLPPPYFQEVNQFSGYLEGSKKVKNNWEVGLAAAIDSGRLLYNSFGLMLNVRKSFQF
ncbi:capsule assembly Wzi family protein [Dyadobacter sp. BHUBP1]|uniref:capsule assembly Wzi family protein n=1 Tax=Dyadobacter sp. BHUBP1 TaxID=3424178 RepID=UPI003D34C74F